MTEVWETDPVAVAYEHMTARGENSPEQIDKLLAENSDPAAWAAEAIEEWAQHVTTVDLTAAIAEFIQERPDR